MTLLKLGKRKISASTMPYVIAEIGVNHEGSLEKAKGLIRLAKEGGADAAKFQSYKADKLASKKSPAYWDTSKEKILSQYELFKKFDSFGEKEYIELAGYCKKLNIDFLSTPFDTESVDYLEPLIPFYKIASADINNLPLLRKIGKKNKPVILSTGASNLDEIHFSIKCLLNSGCNEVALLHCILNYPTLNENANLKMISWLRRDFPNLVVGYSDHTVPDQNMQSLTTAFMLGATIIEKHFTNDKTIPGNDHYHAMDCDDLKRFIHNCKNIQVLLGESKNKEPISSEQLSINHARRSIVTAKSLIAGQEISERDLICKRPASGISPIYWDDIIGLRPLIDLPEDHILQWKDLKVPSK